MKELLLFTVANFGLAFVVGHSKISMPLRMLIDPGRIDSMAKAARAWLIMLLECPACLGFWGGGLYAHFTGYSFGFPAAGFLATLGFALYACGANFLLSALSGMLWKGVPNVEPD